MCLAWEHCAISRGLAKKHVHAFACIFVEQWAPSFSIKNRGVQVGFQVGDNGICVALPKVLELTSIEQRYKVAVRVAAMKCSWNPIFPVNYYTRVIMLCLTEDKNHTGGYYGYADPVLNAFYAHRLGHSGIGSACLSVPELVLPGASSTDNCCKLFACWKWHRRGQDMLHEPINKVVCDVTWFRECEKHIAANPIKRSRHVLARPIFQTQDNWGRVSTFDIRA